MPDKSKSHTKLSEKPSGNVIINFAETRKNSSEMILTCQMPWTPVETRGVALLRGTGLL